MCAARSAARTLARSGGGVLIKAARGEDGPSGPARGQDGGYGGLGPSRESRGHRRHRNPARRAAPRPSPPTPAGRRAGLITGRGRGVARGGRAGLCGARRGAGFGWCGLLWGHLGLLFLGRGWGAAFLWRAPVVRGFKLRLG